MREAFRKSYLHHQAHLYKTALSKKSKMRKLIPTS